MSKVNFYLLPEKTYKYVGECKEIQGFTYKSKGRVSPRYKEYGKVEVLSVEENIISLFDNKYFTKNFKTV